MMQKLYFKNRRNGFSLVEAVMTIVVIFIVLGGTIGTVATFMRVRLRSQAHLDASSVINAVFAVLDKENKTTTIDTDRWKTIVKKVIVDNMGGSGSDGIYTYRSVTFEPQELEERDYSGYGLGNEVTYAILKVTSDAWEHFFVHDLVKHGSNSYANGSRRRAR